MIWDLAPHDLAIMDHVIRDTPEAVVATGGTHFGKHADIAFLTIYFPNNVLAHINVNWMSPVKVRTTLIGGREKMLERLGDPAARKRMRDEVMNGLPKWYNHYLATGDGWGGMILVSKSI